MNFKDRRTDVRENTIIECLPRYSNVYLPDYDDVDDDVIMSMCCKDSQIDEKT